MNKIILWLTLIFSFAASAYCFLGNIMYAWLAATPNYPIDRAKFGSVLYDCGHIFRYWYDLRIISLEDAKKI